MGLCEALCPLLRCKADITPYGGFGAVCGLCEPFAGGSQFRYPQRCPVGAGKLLLKEKASRAPVRRCRTWHGSGCPPCPLP